MKKYFLMFALCMLVLTNKTYAQEVTEVRINDALNNPEISNNEVQSFRYEGGHQEYKNIREFKQYGVRVGYHPDFTEWKYSDGYYFSTSKKRFTTTFSIGAQYGYVNASVSVDRAGNNSGYFRAADGSRLSRPYVVADLNIRVYDIYLYDELGRLTNIYRDHKNVTTENEQIFIDYK